MQTSVAGGGGNRGVTVFCAPLSHDSHPSLCCSRLQVNQEDQKPGFTFQTVPKRNILVYFLAFVWAGSTAQEITPTVWFVIFCYHFVFVVYKIQSDGLPCFLTPHPNGKCLSFVQNKKLR